MKRDLKPFVVEVKRGTRRSSFLGQLDDGSTMNEAQRRADAALFAPAVEKVAMKTVRSDPSRRILQSIVEPAPSPHADLEEEAPVVRPRSVGRPRKIIPPAPLTLPEEPEKIAAVAPPPAVSLEAPPVRSPIADRVMTRATDKLPSDPVPHVMVAKSGERTRLRDRSSILARYVLGTEPPPGERWGRAARRAGRMGRGSSD